MNGDVIQLETHLLKSCHGNDVCTTTPIYHQLIVLPLIYNIGVKPPHIQYRCKSHKTYANLRYQQLYVDT